MSREMYGWLSPGGEYYACEKFGHYDLAMELVGEGAYQISDADDILLRAGFLKVSDAVALSGRAFLSEAQLLFIDSIGIREADVLRAFLPGSTLFRKESAC